jgi:LPXTG-motif cell wall-anchored protein
MYDDNGYAGIPDELPSGYGYADSQPATVHANADTAKAAELFAPQASYSMTTTSDGRGSVQQHPGNVRPSMLPPRQTFTAPPPPRARVVGPRGFQSSGLHTTPSNAISMRARPTEQQIPSGVPKAIRYEDLPGNALDGDDDDALGADYGLTSEEKAAKKKAKEEAKAKAAAEKAAGKQRKAAEKSASKEALRGWQQAAQLGLRFDQARGKWYRDVKIAGGAVEVTQEARPLLTLKAKGPAVKRLQSLLAQRGFPAGTSGTYDAAVKQQVIAFQNSVGLEGDGKVGAETWEALDPTQKDAPGGRTVRQYQEGAVAIMKGSLPAGASAGVVLSPTKFKDLVLTLKADVEEGYGPFPLPGLTPPPANWDFKLGKMKPGFTLDVAALEKQLTKVASKFKPSGTAAPAEESLATDMTVPGGTPSTGEKPTNWLLIGGIAAGVLVIGGLFIAFSGGDDKKAAPAAGAEG